MGRLKISRRFSVATFNVRTLDGDTLARHTLRKDLSDRDIAICCAQETRIVGQQSGETLADDGLDPEDT